MHICASDWLQIGWAVSTAAVQGFILRVLVKNKLRSDFPIFFGYNVLCVVAQLAMIAPFLYMCTGYFYLFSALNVLSMAVEFGVMYEVLVHALKPYSALIDLGKMLFRWAAVFLLLAGLLTALATPGPGTSRIVAASALAERSLRLMQCGLLLLFFSFEKRLGLSWRSYSMSISLGLGVYAAVELSRSYFNAQFPSLSAISDGVCSFAYLAATAFWAICLVRSEPARKNVLDSPSKLIFQRWNEALASHGYGPAPGASTVESFLPGIEKTVDRIMARKIS